jgi:hypothetical protein
MYTNAFLVVLEHGENYTSVIGTKNRYGPYSPNESLIDVVGDKLFVINDQVDGIDVYEIQYESISEKLVNGKIQKSTKGNKLYHLDTFKLPLEKYGLGSLFSITCNDNSCEVVTSYTRDIGCTLDLDINTGVYSNVLCQGRGESFVPLRE